jgi:RNA polymerase sigma-70 factor (ECF subfamily)
LETLVDALRPAVCRWALMWTGDPDEAEDAAQQILIRVYQSIERFEPRARVTTWVYRITQNVLRDGHRRRTREDDARRKLEALARDASASLQTNASEPDVVAGLMRLMEELSPKQRAVLDLVDLQGHQGDMGPLHIWPPTRVRR